MRGFFFFAPVTNCRAFELRRILGVGSVLPVGSMLVRWEEDIDVPWGVMFGESTIANSSSRRLIVGGRHGVPGMPAFLVYAPLQFKSPI